MKNIFYHISIIATLAVLSFACEDPEETGDQETTTTFQVLFTFQRCHILNEVDTTYLDPSGAAVIIYNGAGDESASGTTDANGKVTFRLPNGNYAYLLLEDGRETMSDDGYEIAGIFNSQEDIDNAYVVQPGATVGGPRYVDLNGDGQIDAQDKLTNDTTEFQLQNKDTSIVEVITTYEYISQPIQPEELTEETILQRLGAFTYHFHRKVLDESYKIDAAITRQAPEPIEPPYNSLYRLDIKPDNEAVDRLYSNAYGLIQMSNTTLSVLKKLDSNETLLVRVALYRAYAYSILLNYFGGTPLITEMAQAPNPYPARNTEAEVAQFILSEADRIFNHGDDNLRRFALQLKARIAANNGNYQTACDATKAIIASVNNPGDDSVWNEYDLGDLDEEAAFGDLMQSTAIPPMRYTETLLLCAEAAAMSGRTTEAKELVNTLCSRHSLSPPAPDATPDEIKNRIFELWQNLLYNEGLEYAHLKRTGKFQEVLGNYGAQPHHRYLPIPMREIAQNPNITQNAGY